VKQLSYAAMLVGVLVAVLPLERALGTRVLARPRRLAAALVCAGAPFLCWDLYATSRGHWTFDAAQTLPPRVAGLPLEEVAFFVVIPLAVVFAFEAVRAATGWDGTGSGPGGDP
jgi:lycopene cyclase domain-containing protein